MEKQRITVGYVELTQEESDRLFQEVKKDKDIENYSELQGLMEDFDSVIIEPDARPLAEILDGDEAPTETAQGGTRYIEVFNKLEEDTRYRFESSDQQ
ncbi:hypothetical protein QOZ98_001802 [Planomicrobium stackebrandtii]|uniref:Uncharacterized protein n=1 Tax=Planomicrobium stackebrandtii TaxID=253160 RepID=A0ABU0GUE3_9BACL|nr:hypothetical protein [Planomicrobium stackebrandtii]MDQ0428975.1 hypothetical protein [Planomicrobium stackebrandtii]